MRLPIAAFLASFVAGVTAVACADDPMQAGSGGTDGSGTDDGGTDGTNGRTTSTDGGDAATTDGGDSGTTTSTDSGDGGMPDSAPYPAPISTKPPQVISKGGAVLAHPKIVPVFFSGDDMTLVTKIKDFESKIGATQYWAANTTEYNVGAATATSSVDLTETAPPNTNDTAIQTWLQGKLNGDDPAWPAPDQNTVYVLHYPAGTTITLGGAASCTAFGGYHSNITLDATHGNKNVAYAVIPRCGNFGDLTGIDAVTGPESHELLEAATDPYPTTDPTYAVMDDQHIYWLSVLEGGETADMCTQSDNAFTKFAGLPYAVQRAWSNKAALAGHDPCVPTLPNSIYFNAAPVLPDDVTANISGRTVIVKGVKIAVGASKTIDLELFSDSDTGGPWDVEVNDTATLFGQQPHLSFGLDRTSGQNGEKLHLTITVNSAGKNNTETFVVRSTLNGQKNFWIGLVGN